MSTKGYSKRDAKKSAKALCITVTSPKHRHISFFWDSQPMLVTGIPVSGKAILEKSFDRMFAKMYPV